jgi:hypothetical protein
MNERKLTAEELWERQKARLTAQAAKREQRRAQKQSLRQPMPKASCHLTLVAVNGARIRSGQARTTARHCSRAAEVLQPDLFASAPLAAKPKRLHGGCLLYRLSTQLRAMD